MTHDVVLTSAVDTLPPFDPRHSGRSSTTTRSRSKACGCTSWKAAVARRSCCCPVGRRAGTPGAMRCRFWPPGRRVIALDPRGMGDSDRPASGYEMRTVGAELHGFVEALGLTANGPIDVLGHDIGTWIGYAYAAEWPGDVKRLAVFDAALPGVTPPPPAGIPSAEANVKTWHFAFNRLDDLPEILLQGHEREFLTWLFRAKSTRPWTITPADLDEYVRVNAAPGATRAALSYYRHKLGPEGIAHSRARAERKLALPVLAFGAETGVATALIDTMRLVATGVRGGVFICCGHYMPEEAPRAVADHIITFTRSSLS
jgi:pimeloyl-ACP methyl ester carboxylesterase